MRILAAALGALLISTSQPALASGGHEQQTEVQQTEPQQAEASAAETQPAEAPQPDMQQAETQPAEAQQPDMQQAETQPAEAQQPDMQQAETQSAQPDPRQAVMQQADVTQAAVPLGEPQQPKMRQAAAPQVEPLQGEVAGAPARLPRDVKWTVFVETEYGTRLDIPGAVFALPDGPTDRGVGRQFKTPDGRASLAVYSQRNDARDTPASYLRRNLQSPRPALAYERVTPEFFAIAAVMRGSIYYSRCNFSRNAGRAIHCFDLKYPVQDRESWDGIVTRMSRSLRPLQGG
jgi:DNA mismatch repair ATPase MutL